jgi:glycosyltransferase involved in cell wall biosynthesis
MRVLLISGFIPSRGGGGVERHVYDLALGLIKRGVDVSVACENRQHFPGNYELLKGRLIIEDIRYHDILKPLKVSPRATNLMNACEYSARLFKRSWALSGSLKAGDFDIIHAHAQNGCVSLMKNRMRGGKKVAAVTTLHGTAAGFYASMRRHHLGTPVPTPELASSMLMEYGSVKCSDACIAVSNDVKSIAQRSYGAREGRVHVVNNWADRELFHPAGRAESRRALGLDEDKRYLLFVGRADPMKGYNMLIESMKYVGDEATLLVASGESGKAIAPGNVRHLGYVDEQLPLYYSACDLFMFPSLYEGLPLTLVEAISCGTVPVCMDRPPMREVVGDDMGYFCERFEPGAFAGVVLGALKDPLRDARSRKCVEGSRRFDMDRSIDATRGLYESLLKK